MFNNPYMSNYMQNYNQQNLNDRIDSEIAKLQQMKTNMNQQQTNQQPPAINQTIQLAPTNNNGLKIVSGIEDVQKELTIVETAFVNVDYSILWIKNAKGEIRTFNLEEIKPKDEKDAIIEDLQFQIYNLSNKIKELSSNEQWNDESNVENRNEHESEQLDESIENKTTTNVSNVRTSKSKSK
jgi:hypothetical protein